MSEWVDTWSCSLLLRLLLFFLFFLLLLLVIISLKRTLTLVPNITTMISIDSLSLIQAHRIRHATQPRLTRRDRSIAKARLPMVRSLHHHLGDYIGTRKSIAHGMRQQQSRIPKLKRKNKDTYSSSSLASLSSGSSTRSAWPALRLVLVLIVVVGCVWACVCGDGWDG